jgi:fermentation-respiration switch protein FrsA (DUF1100 family)
MNTLTKRMAGFTGALVLLYASACGYMWATQMAQVFEPSPTLQTTPERMGMKYDEVHIPVGSGADKGELEAWWVPADRQLRHVTGEASRLRELLPSGEYVSGNSTLQANDAAINAPTVLYFHGNYRNIGNNLDHTQRLHQMGYNVLLADYRGYGRSTGGKPSEAKVYEDAQAVWQYLVRQRGANPAKTFIYGHSLGGAIAIDLAVHHPEAAGLITESTFTSMQAMGEKDYGFLPIGLLLNQRFESLKKVPQLKLPVLFIHGTWDKKVPVEMGKQLYAAAPQPKQLLLIEGGEHNNSAVIGAVEYRDAVMNFVAKNTLH